MSPFSDATSRILRSLTASAAAAMTVQLDEDDDTDQGASVAGASEKNTKVAKSSSSFVLPFPSSFDKFPSIIGKNDENDKNKNAATNTTSKMASLSKPRVTFQQEEPKRVKKKSPALPRLPAEECRKLAHLIQKLLSKLVEKERCIGKNVCYWDIMSSHAIQAIAKQAPRTMEELRAIDSLNEETVNTYGRHLVKVVQRFVVAQNLQGYLDGDHDEKRQAPTNKKREANRDDDDDDMSPSSILPRSHKYRLAEMVKKLVTNWAEEERVATGKQIFSWDIISDGTIETISEKVPTSVEDLQAIGTFSESVIVKYGERLVKVVKSFVTTNGLESSKGGRGGSPMKRAKTSSSRLPERDCQKLADLVKKLATNWAEEERALGKQVFYGNVMSHASMQAIVEQVPTTVEELKAIPTLSENTIQEYGERLVKVVQRFVTTNGLEGYLLEGSTKQPAAHRSFV